LDELTKDIDCLADKKAVYIIKVLVNLVEMLAKENALLREENQVLRDEINRLKGGQGKSKDTFATIVLTARKLKVNVYQYIYDRVAKKFEMPSLAELILLKAQQFLSTT